MMIDHRESQIRKRQLSKLAESFVDWRSTRLHASEQVLEPCFIHSGVSYPIRVADTREAEAAVSTAIR